MTGMGGTHGIAGGNGVGADADAVRELLGRAVDGVPVPAGRGSESVFASARRVRRRRRALATGAVAAVAAAGLLGFGTLPGDGGRQSVAAPPGTHGVAIEKLLPGDVGKVRQVSLQELMTGTKPKVRKDGGRYDGDYAVTRGGATGYVSVSVMWVGKDYPDLCGIQALTLSREMAEDLKGHVRVVPVKDGVDQCTTETLPDGRRLNLYRHVGWKAGGILQGSALIARVLAKDGTLVTVQDFSGFTGGGSLGPIMNGYPLTRDQLRALALKPDLRH